jgi:branched-chain amino acid transport system permease protein
MAIMQKREWVLVVLSLGFAICVPLISSNSFFLSLIIPGLILAIAAMAWSTIVRTGQFSMGQGAFMTLGAYASAVATIYWHFPVWLGMICGGILAALVAMLIGMAVLRLGGLYFAIVTLGFGEIVRVVAMNWSDVTQGVYGLIPPALSLAIGGYSVNFVTSKVPYYYASLFLVVVSAAIFWRIDRCRLGRLFRSVASNHELSEHLGIHLMKYRVIAFTVAGFFTGVAGALFSHYLFFVGPTLYSSAESIMLLIMCTVGGISSAVAGPIMGALLLSISGDYLTSLLKGGKALAFGALVVVIIFFLPGGLVDLKRHFSRLMNKMRREPSVLVSDSNPVSPDQGGK